MLYVFLIYVALSLFFFARPCHALGREAQVVITAVVPPETPRGDDVYITGSHPAFGPWKANRVRLERAGGRKFLYRASFPEGTLLEFKFTRGGFRKVEKDGEGREILNRILAVGPGTNAMECRIEAWQDTVEKPEPVDVRELEMCLPYVPIRKFRSKYLFFRRDIVVMLPAGYHSRKDSSRRYPVLYMHDGNNLFDPRASYQGVDWGVDEAVAGLAACGEIEDVIVVGIYNTRARMVEYAPFADERQKQYQGLNYLKFIERELKPLIDSRFRTMPGPKHTAVGGSSMGGIISLFFGLSRPDLFTGMIVMSPALWWGRGRIAEVAAESNFNPETTRIWMDMGTEEGDEMVDSTRKFDSEFRALYPNFKNYLYEEFEGATHSEGAWRERIGLALKHVFGAIRTPSRRRK